jgi:hypothetical protein
VRGDLDQGRLINVITFDIADGAVQAVRSIINPEKLSHLGPLSPIGRRSGSPTAVIPDRGQGCP